MLAWEGANEAKASQRMPGGPEFADPAHPPQLHATVPLTSRKGVTRRAVGGRVSRGRPACRGPAVGAGRSRRGRDWVAPPPPNSSDPEWIDEPLRLVGLPSVCLWPTWPSPARLWPPGGTTGHRAPILSRARAGAGSAWSGPVISRKPAFTELTTGRVSYSYPIGGSTTEDVERLAACTFALDGLFGGPPEPSSSGSSQGRNGHRRVGRLAHRDHPGPWCGG